MFEPYIDSTLRKTCKIGPVLISYSNPFVTPFEGSSAIKDIDHAMYFYYSLDVLLGTKTLFRADIHDFPLVQNLSHYVEAILNHPPREGLLIDFENDGGFHWEEYYYRERLHHPWSSEYYYLLERKDTFQRQTSDQPITHLTDFSLTIGRTKYVQDKKNEDQGVYLDCPVILNHLDERDLRRLAEVSTSFCEAALTYHNQSVREECHDEN